MDRRQAKRRQSGSNKTIVFGMVERSDGYLRAGPIPNASMNMFSRIIAGKIAAGSTISTDEWRAYRMLAHSPYVHGAVNRKVEE